MNSRPEQLFINAMRSIRHDSGTGLTTGSLESGPILEGRKILIVKQSSDMNCAGNGGLRGYEDISS